MNANAPLPDWPALMGEQTAARYLDMSAGHFRRHCPIKPVSLGARKLFRRADLDDWISGLDQKAVAGKVEPQEW
jgi:hypothetical protein